MEMVEPGVFPIGLQYAQAFVTIIVGGLIALVGTIWTIARWYGRPRFAVGVPPTFAEQEQKGISQQALGRRSITTEFKHDSRCLARRLWRERETLTGSYLNRLFSDTKRCRTLELSGRNSATLSVIVENKGRRAARDYIIAISVISPHIHIVDVATESLRFNTFYCNRDDLVENDDLKRYIADKRIVQAYDSYMDVGEQYGDTIFLIGELESGAYEMILTKIVRSDNDTDRFVVRYHLDCSDGWISKQTFFQGFTIGK